MVKLKEKEKFSKQDASTRHLTVLVVAFGKHSRNECVKGELRQLGMTKEQFTSHFEHRERFETGATDYETYDAVLKSLHDEALRKLSKHTLEACKIHHTSNTKKIRRAAMKLIKRIAWVPDDFAAGKDWCSGIRRQLGVQDARGRKPADVDEKNDFDRFVQAQFDETDAVPLSKCVQKYKDLFPDKTYKARETFFRRFRKANSIDSVKIVEEESE